MCLKLVPPYLPAEALALVEPELLVPQRRQAAHDRTQAVLGEAAAYLESSRLDRARGDHCPHGELHPLRDTAACCESARSVLLQQQMSIECF
jgi:hypothetical protein